MKKPVFLLVALVSFGFFFFYAHAGVEEWNRGDAAAAVLAETYTGETKGQKVSPKSYHDFRATRYRAEFVYEVNGKTYHTQTDTGIEPWAEEEVHYNPADPAQCYVGLYPQQEDDSGTYLGIAVAAFIIAIVFVRAA